jgi:hypothetical protein
MYACGPAPLQELWPVQHCPGFRARHGRPVHGVTPFGLVARQAQAVRYKASGCLRSPKSGSVTTSPARFLRPRNRK